MPKDVEQAYTKRFGAGVGDLTRSIGAKPRWAVGGRCRQSVTDLASS